MTYNTISPNIVFESIVSLSFILYILIYIFYIIGLIKARHEKTIVNKKNIKVFILLTLGLIASFILTFQVFNMDINEIIECAILLTFAICVFLIAISIVFRLV